MSHSNTQQQINKEEKRKRILNTALELFANQGFHATSMSELAKAAGISKGSVYTYFPAKKELLRSLIFETYLTIFNMIDLNRDGHVSVEEFLGLLDRFKPWISNNQKFLRLYFSILLQPQVLVFLEKELSEINRFYLEPLEKFFSDHHFPDPEVEVKYFSSMLDGISFNYLTNPEHYPLDKALQRMKNHYSKQLI